MFKKKVPLCGTCEKLYLNPENLPLEVNLGMGLNGPGMCAKLFSGWVFCVLIDLAMELVSRISGVSSGKAARYGKPFVEMIKQYVEENEIERPTEIVVKQVANKSRVKVNIIQR